MKEIQDFLFNDISKRAFHKEKLEDFSNLPTKYAYLQMRELYRAYDNGGISKADALKMRTRIKKEFECNLQRESESLEICKIYNENRGKVETDMYYISKTDDKDILLDKAFKIISKLLNDETIYNNVIQKINNRYNQEP